MRARPREVLAQTRPSRSSSSTPTLLPGNPPASSIRPHASARPTSAIGAWNTPPADVPTHSRPRASASRLVRKWPSRSGTGIARTASPPRSRRANPLHVPSHRVPGVASRLDTRRSPTASASRLRASSSSGSPSLPSGTRQRPSGPANHQAPFQATTALV